MRRYLLFMLLLFATSVVRGVLIEEPVVEEYCIKTANMNDFPGYTFLLTIDHPWPVKKFEVVQLKDDACISVQDIQEIYHVHGKLYAIKSEDYKPTGEHISESDFETADRRFGGSSLDTVIIPSDLEIVAYVADSEKKYDKIMSVVRIVSVKEEGMILEYENKHLKKDGSIEKVYFRTNKPVLFPNRPYIALPLLALIVLAGFLVYKVYNKYKKRSGRV